MDDTAASPTHPPASPTTFTARTVVCPACGGPSRYAPDNRFRPFCSERCKHLDLGAWASESFRVPASAPPDPSVPEGEQGWG